METKKILNGIDTVRMVQTVEAIKKQPELARFEFRAKNRWDTGGTNHSKIDGFYGAGREDDSRKKPFLFTNGEPPALLGNNEGANPVEFLLHAAAGCLTTTFILQASARGISISEMSTELDGDIDLRGLLDLDASVPPGYKEIRIKMNVKADCSDREIEDLIDYAKKHSPVLNTISRPVQVTVKRAAP